MVISSLGNEALLERQWVGFMAASYIEPLSVLPSLDWAVAMAHREEVAVVGGWSSPLERDVLRFLLEGRCGIVWLLARRMYAELSAEWHKPMAEGRLMVLSCSNGGRQCRKSALQRNEEVAAQCLEIVMPAAPKTDSSLYAIYTQYQQKIHLLTP